VCVAYPHPGEVAAPFHKSLVALMVYDAMGGIDPDGKHVGGHGHVTRHGSHLPMSSGANIVAARNLIAKEFLAIEPTQEWLWFIDADMEFPPNVLDALLASADPVERPIVGGLCFAVMKSEASQPIVPTLYMPTNTGKLGRWNGYPPEQLVQVAGTGAACLLIHRSVLEAMRDAVVNEELAAVTGAPEGTLRFPPPWPWFAESITGRDWGDSMSEDLTFCMRAATCGFPIWVDTRIKIGHQKPFVVDEAMFKLYTPKAEPPAPTFVVIPVRGKQDITESILTQLDKQGGFEKVFLFDNGTGDDVYGRPLPDVVERIPTPGKNIHQMWNEGIREAVALEPRCNVLILNNDLELDDDFVEEMGVAARLHPAFPAVSANYDDRQMVEKIQGVHGICANRYDGTGGFAGFAFIVRGEMFGKQLPWFDEDYELWFGDNDFLMELETRDFAYGIARDAQCHHLDGGSQTDKAFASETEPMKVRDRARFEKKWAAR